MRFIRIVAVMLSVFLAAVSCHAAPATSASDTTEVEKLIVGIDKAYPPYEFTDTSGKPAGFTVELIRLLGGELGA
ncbi:MAG TPA: transporter substrate-binding domain-containing protein, partial [Candidatus Ozemobacteraceae bacterium]|nr:transporter substrate-binding domain-containing protein [Candidatus Ozemobacteraceae bacterium]